MTSAHEAQCITRALLVVAMLMALASPAPNLLPAAEPSKRTLIRSVPAGNVYSYENAAGETVEETENRQGKLILRRFYRPAPPACAYLQSVGLGTNRYWRDDGERLFHCLSPYKELGTVADPLGLGQKNNLAYYVDGDAERIHQMRLVLNVYHGVKPRHEAKQATTAGNPWQGTAKTATLELVRDDWPTGKGYTLDFTVRPNQERDAADDARRRSRLHRPVAAKD